MIVIPVIAGIMYMLLILALAAIRFAFLLIQVTFYVITLPFRITVRVVR